MNAKAQAKSKRKQAEIHLRLAARAYMFGQRMVGITETLSAEHAVFCGLFDFIELTQARLDSLGKVKLLASLVATLLYNHAEAENKLLFATLNHALAEKGRLTHLHQEHQDLDARLARVQAATHLADGLRFLKEAMIAARIHFAREERHLFPFIERTLEKETLVQLNEAWRHQRRALLEFGLEAMEAAA